MRRVIYISIDDTDEIGYLKSTGMLTEMMAEFIDSNFAPCSFVSRHQLFIDERINYTSHNSSMCFTTHLDENEFVKVIKFVEKLLIDESAPSSEPGFAIAFEDEILNINEFIKFGKRAKCEYITKDEAYSEAAKQNIYLKELKNAGHSIIGTLSGIALRLDGNDGRVKGKTKMPKDEMSVKELLDLGFCDEVLDENFNLVDKKEKIITKSKLKLIVKNFKAVLLVKSDKNGKFIPYDIEELREF
ncbi:hypothetical protein [Campylobacter sp. RM16192]|uniref:hypothetical protein n=1 Tax=Campylobacter sp. RM16192 TaxID=1660080 RepID=UPI001451F139|nr:hypothetical protein [Campylobacter sp. RM16192]QCD53388.1 hypothetical protein CDOMC_1806 [Campylobacter sp. RM16192]